MKKAFSLTEVLISVVIVSMIGTVLLYSHNNSLDIFTKLDNKNNESIFAISFPALWEYNELQKTTVRLEEFYSPKDDEVRRFFKDRKYEFSEEEGEIIKFEDEEYLLSFEVVKSSLGSKNHTSNIYKLRYKTLK